MEAAYFLMGLRYTEEMIDQLYRGATMLEESVTYQRTLRRGEVRGIQDAILLQGKNKFGEPSAEIATIVRGILNRDRLDRLVTGLLTASSWDELLATP